MPEVEVWTDITRGHDWLLGAVLDATYEDVLNRPLRAGRDITKRINQECSKPITDKGVMACMTPILEDLDPSFRGTSAEAVEMRKKFLFVFKRRAKEFIEEVAEGVL